LWTGAKQSPNVEGLLRVLGLLRALTLTNASARNDVMINVLCFGQGWSGMFEPAVACALVASSDSPVEAGLHCAWVMKGRNIL